jgi:type IV pilus assembly protein PilM
VEYDGITAIGIGADILGLTELLSNELEMEVRQLTNIKDVTILDKNKEIQLGEYAAAIGAGIRTWNIIPAGMGIQKDLKESLFLPFIVGVGCVVISMALYVYGQIDYSIQVSDRDAKIEQKNSLADAQAKEDAYEQAVSDYNAIVAISNAATNNNSELVDFLGDMEINLPKSFDVQSLTSDNTQVVMSCTVDTKEEAATVISELRKFDLISTVTSSGFSETDAGVSFTLTCTYASTTDVAAAN